MAIKFIFHFPSLEAISEVLINSVPATNKPLVVLSSYEGKHTQVSIQPFNSENADKAVLPFGQRVAFYAKTLRPASYNVPFFVTEVEANAIVFAAITGGVDLSAALADFLSGLTTPVTTGYEGNFIGFFDGNTVDLETNSPAAATDFAQGLAGN